MRYSQNNEQAVIQEYFAGNIGIFLDIGANDGRTFSNTRALAEQGWAGLCIEPSPNAYRDLSKLYHDRQDIHCFRFAVGGSDADGRTRVLHECSDSLTSTLIPERTPTYIHKGQTFTEEIVSVVNFNYLQRHSPFDNYDMISIDAEGMDWQILQQIDLEALKVKLVVIEHGDHYRKIRDHCSMMTVIHKNGENLIMAR